MVGMPAELGSSSTARPLAASGSASHPSVAGGRARHPLAGLGLDREPVLGRVAPALGPDMGAVADMDGLDRDPHPIAPAPKRALQPLADAEIPADLPDVDGPALA